MTSPVDRMSGVPMRELLQGYRGGAPLGTSSGLFQDQFRLSPGGRLAAAVGSARSFALVGPHEFLWPTALLASIAARLDNLVGRKDSIVQQPRAREIAWREARADWLRSHYLGRWIALEGESIVAQGESAAEVAAAARRLGVGSPYLFRVTQEDGDNVGWFGL